MNLKKAFLIFVIAFSILASARGADDVASVPEYMPRIRGAVRARWENDFDIEKSRFQLRNARIVLDGNIAPVIDYYFQVDICDRGTMKFLDGWARMEVCRGLKIQAGQFRVPFGVDPFRGPGTYVFSNRSFIGKTFCNIRAVGGKVSYAFPRVPLTLEGGIFNPSSIADHTGWHSSYAYAGRVIYRPGNFRFEGGCLSIRPDGVRANLLDVAAGWFSDRWDLGAEYMYKHYTHSAHRPSHAYVVWSDWKMPVKFGVFNRLSLQGRVDGMTDHCNGLRDDTGRLTTTHPTRHRLTFGATLSYIHGRRGLDIRADYEKYFYRSGIITPEGGGDKLVVELILRF